MDIIQKRLYEMEKKDPSQHNYAGTLKDGLYFLRREFVDIEKYIPIRFDESAIRCANLLREAAQRLSIFPEGAIRCAKIMRDAAERLQFSRAIY